MPAALFLLAACSFVIGTGEFVIMGLLPQIAGSLHVSLPQAGLLVSGYALGVVVSAPSVTLVTGAARRDRLLFFMMLLFTAGSLLCATAPAYWVLLAGRVMCALAHGTFLGVGVVVAAGLVRAERASGAVGLVFAGITFSSVLGVPLGTLLGQHYGWHSTFLMVTLASALVTSMLPLMLPRIAETRAHGLRGELLTLRSPSIPLALMITVLVFAAIFTVFTFIAPVLTAEANFQPAEVSLALLVFGIGMTIGVNIGGVFADRFPTASGLLLPLLLMGVLTSLPWAVHQHWTMLLDVFLLGLSGAMMVPGLQMRVMRLTASAPTLASSLNISAFNIGNAAGAWAGSLAVEGGLSGLSVIGGSLALAAFGVTGLSLLVMRVEQTASPSRHAL